MIAQLMLSAVIEDYKTLKEPETQRALKTILRQLPKDLLQLDSRFAMVWTSNMRRKGLSDATIRQRLALIRSLFGHFLELDLITKNPWNAAWKATPHGQARQVNPTAIFPLSQIREVLNLPSDRTPRGVQHRAVLALLFGGAMRRGEVSSLNVGDFRTWGVDGISVIIRHSKAQKYQEQPLPRWARERFSMLISLRKRQGATESDPAFITNWGTRMTGRTIHRVFTKYARQIGIKAAPHSARAAAVTKYLTDTKGDVIGAQRLLRHSTIKQASMYDKRRTDESFNPANSLDYGLKNN